MDIKKVGGHASLIWNGTRTKLDVLSVDGKLVLAGDSSMIDGEVEYFVKITNQETFEQIMNILNAVES